MWLSAHYLTWKEKRMKQNATWAGTVLQKSFTFPWEWDLRDLGKLLELFILLTCLTVPNKKLSMSTKCCDCVHQTRGHDIQREEAKSDLIFFNAGKQVSVPGVSSWQSRWAKVKRPWLEKCPMGSSQLMQTFMSGQTAENELSWVINPERDIHVTRPTTKAKGTSRGKKHAEWRSCIMGRGQCNALLWMWHAYGTHELIAVMVFTRLAQDQASQNPSIDG